MKAELFRALPSVDALSQRDDVGDLITGYGRDSVIEAIRAVLDDWRAGIQNGQITQIDDSAIVSQISQQLDHRFTPTLRPVINATGVILHTNLGRAPLSDSAQEAIREVASNYNTLEFNLDTGKRGSRLIHAEALLQDITGAESAVVVNNNASAMVLLLAGLAMGKEVIVSRGQLVEIGGGFRVPDVMRQSGANLVEVGATNRTRIADYANAITENTALLMRVHTSNFKQIGFTEDTPLSELVALAREHGLAVVDDIGSGALVDTAQFGLTHEPMVQASLDAGVDVVAFSGDKLLGGTQAGILVGKAQYIDPLKKHPLARAIRADKLCLAGLSATLDHYRRGDAIEQIPILRMMARTYDDVYQQAQDWLTHLQAVESAFPMQIIDGESTVGGGSLPSATLPTALLAITVTRPDEFMSALRGLDAPIIARIEQNQVLFDPRTVLPHQSASFVEGVATLIRS